MLSAVVATHQAYINEEGLNLEFEYDPHVYVYGDATCFARLRRT